MHNQTKKQHIKHNIVNKEQLFAEKAATPLRSFAFAPACEKAELWLPPFLRCSNSILWRNSDENSTEGANKQETRKQT